MVHPDICNGQPIFEGTRIPIQTILGFLTAGDSIEDIFEEFPKLTREDILGCLGFSSQLTRHHFHLQEVA
jgi:uncharacterized protein (DUF433 family)